MRSSMYVYGCVYVHGDGAWWIVRMGWAALPSTTRVAARGADARVRTKKTNDDRIGCACMDVYGRWSRQPPRSMHPTQWHAWRRQRPSTPRSQQHTNPQIKKQVDPKKRYMFAEMPHGIFPWGGALNLCLLLRCVSCMCLPGTAATNPPTTFCSRTSYQSTNHPIINHQPTRGDLHLHHQGALPGLQGRLHRRLGHLHDPLPPVRVY